MSRVPHLREMLQTPPKPTYAPPELRCPWIPRRSGARGVEGDLGKVGQQAGRPASCQYSGVPVASLSQCDVRSAVLTIHGDRHRQAMYIGASGRFVADHTRQSTSNPYSEETGALHGSAGAGVDGKRSYAGMDAR